MLLLLISGSVRTAGSNGWKILERTASRLLLEKSTAQAGRAEGRLGNGACWIRLPSIEVKRRDRQSQVWDPRGKASLSYRQYCKGLRYMHLHFGRDMGKLGSPVSVGAGSTGGMDDFVRNRPGAPGVVLYII